MFGRNVFEHYKEVGRTLFRALFRVLFGLYQGSTRPSECVERLLNSGIGVSILVRFVTCGTALLFSLILISFSLKENNVRTYKDHAALSALGKKSVTLSQFDLALSAEVEKTR